MNGKVSYEPNYLSVPRVKKVGERTVIEREVMPVEIIKIELEPESLCETEDVEEIYRKDHVLGIVRVGYGS